jgi:uncharacterized repeat protein (TIGR04052 family)
MRARLLLIALLASGVACGDDDGGTPVAITFAGQIGDAPFACGGTYSGVGTTGTELTVSDFRFYVHDVRFVTEDGAEVPVALDDDDAWQNGEVALLDFEDASASCEGGTPQTNAMVSGRAEAEGPYTGIRFKLGVPFDLNHANAATADSPLNLTSMFWGWQGGYKFIRSEGTSTGLPDGWLVHLGSTGCDGGLGGGVTMCTRDNVAEIALDGFDPTAGVVVADLGGLLSTSNMDENAMDTPAGCMATESDADCGPIFANLGVAFGATPAGTQSFFRSE